MSLDVFIRCARLHHVISEELYVVGWMSNSVKVLWDEPTRDWKPQNWTLCLAMRGV